MERVVTEVSLPVLVSYSYQPGKAKESYDKQYVRDWLDNVAKWNHQPPAPKLPAEIVQKTAERY